MMPSTDWNEDEVPERDVDNEEIWRIWNEQHRR